MERKAKPDNILEVTPEEIADVRQAVEASDFSARNKSILLALIAEILTIKKTQAEKKAELARIRRMLGESSEKRETPGRDEKPKPKAKSHGRLGSNNYRFSKTISHAHQTLTSGQSCPDCACGKLQNHKPRQIIRLRGNAPIEAELHQPESFRCGACGQIFNAEISADVGEEKADESANAVVAVFRYGLGIPHYRLAQIQRAMGVPLPASTQYEMVEMLWTQVMPVFQELLRQAADWPLLFVDDTPAKVLELMEGKEERKAAGERVGIFTTAIVAQNAGRQIHLFFTGRNHAGENLATLLRHRNDELAPPMQMSDALSRNLPKEDGMTIVALCLIHGRRNFIDCEEAFPDEAAYVIERIGLVYKHEKHCREKGLDDQQRLAYHQQFSQEPMDEIKRYAEQKINGREVEPNSVLGQAFQYLLNHWTEMTRFLSIPGAPIDNNVAERLIKRSILHKKNSLFFKTENGARVGDCLMSLIQTCIAADENPMDYLTVLQQNSRHVTKNPHLWLPWNYHNTLRSVGPPQKVTETSTASATTSA